MPINTPMTKYTTEILINLTPIILPPFLLKKVTTVLNMWMSIKKEQPFKGKSSNLLNKKADLIHDQASLVLKKCFYSD